MKIAKTLQELNVKNVFWELAGAIRHKIINYSWGTPHFG